MSSHWITRSSLLAGAAAAIGASACCAGPLVLVLIGVGGAWGSRLLALAPLQPFFVAAAVAAFGFAFHRLVSAAGGSLRAWTGVCDPRCTHPAARHLLDPRRRRHGLDNVSALCRTFLLNC